jgi:DNA-directed RNA polymerase subunit RPC12/RpoP
LPDLDRTCFQCGKARQLAITEESIVTSPGWLVCGHCGERIITVADMQKQVEDETEERVKRNLGFYDFKAGAREA